MKNDHMFDDDGNLHEWVWNIIHSAGNCTPCFEDERIGYVEIQIDRDDWEAARKAFDDKREQVKERERLDREANDAEQARRRREEQFRIDAHKGKCAALKEASENRVLAEIERIRAMQRAGVYPPPASPPGWTTIAADEVTEYDEPHPDPDRGWKHQGRSEKQVKAQHEIAGYLFGLGLALAVAITLFVVFK